MKDGHTRIQINSGSHSDMPIPRSAHDCLEALTEAQNLWPLTLGEQRHFQRWQNYTFTILTKWPLKELNQEFERILNQMLEDDFPHDPNSKLVREMNTLLGKMNALTRVTMGDRSTPRVILRIAGEREPAAAFRYYVFGDHPLPDLADIEEAARSKKPTNRFNPKSATIFQKGARFVGSTWKWLFKRWKEIGVALAVIVVIIHFVVTGKLELDSKKAAENLVNPPAIEEQKTPNPTIQTSPPSN
jgi:hypothetical protein